MNTDAANIKPVIRDYVSLCQYYCIVRKTKELQLTYTTSKTAVKWQVIVL